MAGNLCKIIVLLLPATVTVGLLSFCLISDWWINIDEAKLDDFKVAQAKSFDAYLKGEATATPTNDRAFKKTTPSTTTTITTTFTTTATTTAKTSITTEFKQASDDLADDYDSNSNTNESMYDDEETTKASSSPASGLEANYDDADESSGEFKRMKKLRKRRDNATPNKVDFVYVTKLWPLIKSKSLYSECIRYEKVTLKMSMQYLSLPNKEPIRGTIHYGDALNRSSTSGTSDECKGKMGMISCLLSKECVQGVICDGIVDCDDNTDEQFCGASTNQVCHTSNGGFQCDNKCWQYWNKCDQIPHCLDLSDELSNQCALINEKQGASRRFNTPDSLLFGQNQYDYRQKCFRTYFNFKTPKLIQKENLKYLTPSFTDKLQATNIINYHLHLIYAMALLFAFVFSVLALTSLLFMVCLQKSCIQCPFWFYGFFELLTWLSCSVGLMTFLVQRAYANNPTNFPFEYEIFTLNKNFPDFQIVGITFWIAVAANGVSFLASIMSCIFCCRLPSTRHENKEYKIMQLPTYN